MSTAGGTRPLWSPNGSELFYQTGPGTVMAVPVETTPAFSAGRPEPIVQGDYQSPNAGRSYDVSSDGRRFLMVKDVGGNENSPPTQIVLVQNWFEELKERLPSR